MIQWNRRWSLGCQGAAVIQGSAVAGIGNANLVFGLTFFENLADLRDEVYCYIRRKIHREETALQAMSAEV